MRNIAKEDKLDEEYDITLEATHHGPLLDSPTLYLEIGSDEERWSDPGLEAFGAGNIRLLGYVRG